MDKVRIILRSYDHYALDESIKHIIFYIKKHNIKFSGPVPMPVKRKSYCVLQSPHKDKDAREHFVRIIHKRIIDILEYNQKTFQGLVKLELPFSVDVDIKLYNNIYG